MKAISAADLERLRLIGGCVHNNPHRLRKLCGSAASILAPLDVSACIRQDLRSTGDETSLPEIEGEIDERHAETTKKEGGG